MHEQFLRVMGDGVHKRETLRWLRKFDLEVETEALICAAQKQALCTSNLTLIKMVNHNYVGCAEKREKVQVISQVNAAC